MSHLTKQMILDPDDRAIDHLEVCQPCRSQLTPSADLDSIHERLLAHTIVQAVPKRRRRSVFVAVGSGMALVVATASVALFALGGDQPQTSPAAEIGEAVLPPPVVLPDEPPEPRPEDTAPPVPPSDSQAWPAHESVFSNEARDEFIQIIWASPTFYVVRHTEIVDGVPTLRLGFSASSEDSRYVDDPSGRLVPPPWSRGVPPDPEVPWGELLIPGDATAAIDDAGMPMSVTGLGGTFERLTMDERAVAGEEIESLGFDVEYAAFLLEQTSQSQATLLADGLVTKQELRSAAQNASECSGVPLTEADGEFVFGTGEMVDACIAEHFEDVRAVWRLGHQRIPVDEWTQIYHLIRGEQDVIDMLDAEKGPEMTLASGNGWAISIAERGNGFCTRTSFPSGGSNGCAVPSQWNIPSLLSLQGSILAADGEVTSVVLIGVVAESVDTVRVSFTGGEIVDIESGDLVRFGFRGFGEVVGGGFGNPELIELISANEVVGRHELSAFGDPPPIILPEP